MTQPMSVEDMTERYPGTNRQTWANHRYRGTGPKFFRVGRKIFYRPEDVADWEANSTISRTDEIPAA